MTSNYNYGKFFVFIFFLIYLLIGVFTYKDYGVNIEEQTQLYSGFFWLSYIVDFFSFGELKLKTINYLSYLEDKSLPSPEIYGPIFDVPTAFIDIFFNFDGRIYNYEYRHLIIFLIFFFSSICVYQIFLDRFNSTFLSIFGTSLYIFSPRIYGDSFHNNKDILFLSLVVFSIYFIFKIFDKRKIKYIFLFSIFSALATSTRVMGIFLPTSLILFLILENKKGTLKKNIKFIILIILTYCIFLYLHWPYLWENPIFNLIEFIKKSKNWIYSYYILFNGKYFLTTNLPDSFIFTWIGITTPIINLLFFFLGYYFILKRVFKRFISIKEYTSLNNDFWRGGSEKKDFYIFLSISFLILILLSLNVSLVSGWRHLYFLNFFIVYIAIFYVKIILLLFRNKSKKILYGLLTLLLLPAINKIIVLHPFQSLYFNELLADKKKNEFLVDRDGLTSLDSFKKIISIEEKKEIVNLANASFLPYYRIAKSLKIDQQKKLNFTGTDYNNADYIFNNFVYEVDPKYNNKYKIPDNFRLVYSLEIDGIKMYELYKKKEH